MTYEDIIKVFHTIVDDQSELSGSEELRLATRVERKIAIKREWLALEKEHTGTISGSVVALPDDFRDFRKEYEHQVERALYIGNDRHPIMPNQRRYRDAYCTLDMKNKQIKTPNLSGSVEFDYIHTIPERTLTDSPFMNSDYAAIIAYGMALEFEIIEQSEAAYSKRKENMIEFESFMDAMETNDNDLREVGEVY